MTLSIFGLISFIAKSNPALSPAICLLTFQRVQMKKPHLSTFTLLWFSFVFLFNGCAPSGGSNSSSPDYEGNLVAQCKESEDISGLYIKNTFSLSGTKYNDETLTYSDAECTQRSSGLDFRANGTFTTETGGVVDGKQLIKINYVATITYIEGPFSAFYPVGSTYNLFYENYIDGNKFYSTNGETNPLDGKYVDATQIKYDKYWVKQ